ncbi:uncharacterized protein LOC106150495 isoform X1 [Lingula anatina]|uniref:Uncharacterized protein LOC106150495 isoform X1 n=1 Tax=Lingula anatina TaxID=7574 RepID=A0A1S3GYR0_LINAN|nr:uncharacterized protein LOC106150495 isoform X1 [Lingula anatina]|eukprot:XP_013378802.1 uncharacterized protein LOC106150495 isoform X1 [Lingula anatina]
MLFMLPWKVRHRHVAVKDFIRLNPRLQKKLSFDEKRSLTKLIEQLSGVSEVSAEARQTALELQRVQATLDKVTEEKVELENYIRRKEAIRKSSERGSAIVSDIRSRRDSVASEQKTTDVARLEREITRIKGETYDKDVCIKGLKKEIEIYTSILTLVDNIPERESLQKFSEERRMLYREDYILRLRQEVRSREKDISEIKKKAVDLKKLRAVLNDKQACIRL